MEGKTCTKCGESKPLDAFYADSSKRDGSHARCKSCHNAKTAAWKKANPDKVKAHEAAYRSANSQAQKVRVAAWAKANRDRQTAVAMEWCKANPNRVKAAQKTWADKNPDKLKRKEVEKVETLKPCYVAKVLRIPVADLTPELLDLKREQIELHRLSKQIKNHLEEQA